MLLFATRKKINYMKPSIKSVSLDQLGITASIVCAVHCAALPFIITTLPLWGLEFLAHSWVELSMICLSLIIGICSLSTSFPKHKKALPITVLVTGFSFIAIGHYAFHNLEAFLIPLGGFTIAAAHYLNWRYSRNCNHHKTK